MLKLVQNYVDYHIILCSFFVGRAACARYSQRMAAFGFGFLRRNLTDPFIYGFLFGSFTQTRRLYVRRFYITRASIFQFLAYQFSGIRRFHAWRLHRCVFFSRSPVRNLHILLYEITGQAAPICLCRFVDGVGMV